MGCLRLLLAFSVVLAHSAPLYGFRGMGGEAVPAFFVISGFYMGLVLSTKYVGRVADFYAHRALRIFPMYWATLAIVLVSVGGSATAMDVLIVGTDFSRALWPEQPLPLVPQIWSVASELVFYALAPLIIRLSARAFWALFSVSAASAVLLTDHAYLGVEWSHLLPAATLVYFLLGIAAQRCTAPKWTAAVPFVFFIAWGYVWNDPNPHWHGLADSAVHLALWSAYAFSISALFRLSRESRWDAALGELSYPVYLVHGLFVARGGLIAMMMSCAVAYVLILTVDRPIRLSRPGRGNPTSRALR